MQQSVSKQVRASQTAAEWLRWIETQKFINIKIKSKLYFFMRIEYKIRSDQIKIDSVYTNYIPT